MLASDTEQGHLRRHYDFWRHLYRPWR